MKRNFDPIDIIFIVLILCYFLALFLTIFFIKKKKIHILQIPQKEIKKASKKYNISNKDNTQNKHKTNNSKTLKTSSKTKNTAKRKKKKSKKKKKKNKKR